MAKKECKFFCKSFDGSINYTSDGNFIYAEKDGVIVRLDLFDGHYYKLRPFDGIPILEIDGLRMQLVRDFKTPLDYAKEVVKQLRISKKGEFSVFDSCMGLGYTAIEAAKQSSVKMVVTCEFSPAVITLAQWNPFSDFLFAKNTKIVLMRGSSSELINDFQSNMFDFVIHDPPRFSHAPDLYSKEFYSNLHRVCKKNARIFHYVGSVGKEKGRKIESEVQKRLSAIGFKNIKHIARLQGLVFEKL
ncbi:MAG: SAM-dependent methyltransferase [Candidatus Micrarchaeota archaeon]